MFKSQSGGIRTREKSSRPPTERSTRLSYGLMNLLASHDSNVHCLGSEPRVLPLDDTPMMVGMSGLEPPIACSQSRCHSR